MEKKKISLKKFMAPAEAAAKLEDLAAAFRSGLVRIEKDDQVLNLRLSDPVEIEISAREKKDKAVFSLELSWFCGNLEKDIEIAVGACGLYADDMESEDFPAEGDDAGECLTVTTCPGGKEELSDSPSGEEFEND
ncbi:MAG: amphi-Trp domain-containing protein [Deltaproteobacteria bacterium]|nr:amphi-Trp domain-containing protein [Deltaproteobacteria bacterium]